MRAVVRAAGLAALMGLAACAGDGKDIEVAQQARTRLVGLPKATLLSCAGVPARQAVVNGSEYLTYSRRPELTGDLPTIGLGLTDPTGEGGGLTVGLGIPPVGSPRGCDATFVLHGGVVQQVTYPTGASLEECGALVSGCLPR